MHGWSLLAPSDASLVERVLKDDAAAFELLVARFQKRAHAVALALGVARASVDDVVQESFLKAFENLPSLEAPGRFGPWFLQIVRNSARSRLRARPPVAGLDLEKLPAPAGPPPEDLELNTLLWRKVAELPEGIREAIYLYYHEGESASAVARALDLSRPAALKRLQRGRELLREELWKCLRESLRDKLPSTRDWDRKGRQLTILLFGAATASWATRAAIAAAGTGTAAGAGMAGGSGSSSAGSLIGSVAAAGARSGFTSGAARTLILEGAFMTSKKIGISLGIAACVFFGGLALFFTVSGPPGRPRDAGAALDVRGPASGSTQATPVKIAELPAGREEGAAKASGAAVAAEATPSLEGGVASLAGQPVEGANVIALPLEPWATILAGAGPEALQSWGEDALPRLRSLFAEYQRRAAALPRTTTNAQGKYAFFGLEAGEHRVIVTHPDYLPSRDAVVLVPSAGTARRDVVLREGQSISGRVVNAQGVPVAGVQVTARETKNRVDMDSSRQGQLLEAWSEARFLHEPSPAVTGADGTFRVTSLELTLYDLRARADGRVEAWLRDVPGGKESVEIALEDGFSITGTVLVADSQPVEGAAVTLQLGTAARPKPEQVGEAMYSPISDDVPVEDDGQMTTRTDDRGRFVLRAVRSGVHELAIEREGFLTWKDELRVREAPLDVGKVTLDRARSIRGRVLDLAGAPVPGARVWIEETRRRGMPNWGGSYAITPALVETRAGDAGEFSLDVPPAGTYTVRAASARLAPAKLLGVAAGTEGLELRLEDGMAVRGRVIDGGDGSPLAGAVVTLLTGLSDVEVPEKRVKTGADGQFEILGFERTGDEIRLRASHDQYRGPPLVRKLGYEVPSDPITIELHPPEEIRGRLRNAAGESMARARVRIELPGMRRDYVLANLRPGLGTARSREDGTFSLLVLRQLREYGATLELVAESDSGEQGRVVYTAPPGGKEPWPEVELVLTKGTPVTGHVVDVHSQPVARAVLRAFRAGASQPAAVVHSGRDGAYEFEGLEPGTYEISAQASGFAPASAENVEVGSELVTQDLVLDLGVTLEGRVVDDTGRGVEGAELLALVPRDEDRATGESGAWDRHRRRWRPKGAVIARTTVEGRYRVEHFLERDCTLVARATGHEPSELAPLRPGERPPELVLRRLAELEGTVTDAETGLPVPLFRLYLFRHRDRSDEEFIPRDFDDPQGRFSLDSLPASSYIVAVTARGYATFAQDVSLAPGGSFDARVSLERGKSVRCTVKDAETGAPLVRASLHCYARQSPAPMAERETLWTGSDGSLTLSGLLPGKHSLYVSHPNYERHEGKFVVAADEDPAPIEILLRAAGRVSGTIAGWKRAADAMDSYLVLQPSGGDANAGEPAAEGDKAKGETYRYIRFDGEGRYEVQSVRPGTYDVILREDLLTREVKAGESFGPGDIREKLTPLGQVEVRAGETARFDARVP